MTGVEDCLSNIDEIMDLGEVTDAVGAEVSSGAPPTVRLDRAQSTTWAFVPKGGVSAAQPALVDTQRPPRVSRVRAVQGGAVSTVPTEVPVTAVEARFDDESR